jgi:integral membrane sensor domain MASE1
MTSLIGFHRFLIGFGILFCFGFAIWEMVTWWVTRATGALALTVLFLIFGVGLTYYLSRLRDFVGYVDEE